MKPRIYVGPERDALFAEAVEGGGGRLVDVPEELLSSPDDLSEEWA